MGNIVVAEDVLLGPARPHALDHRGVVEFVGDEHAIRQDLPKRRERRQVGEIAAAENQRRLLAVRAASSFSKATIGEWLPEMLRVPPAPAPKLSTASFIAARTAGCWPMFR